MAIKIWKLKNLDKSIAEKISKKNNISMFLALMLNARNISDNHKIEELISEDYAFSDPFDFADMDKAVKRIRSAIEHNEKICIFAE